MNEGEHAVRSDS